MRWIAAVNFSSYRESRATREPQATGLVGPRFTVVFFSVNVGVIEAIARALQIARTDAKHLHAACAALDAFPNAMLVVSTAVRHSDRAFIEEHAQRSKASVLWVGPDDDANEVVTRIASWATTRRQALTARGFAAPKTSSL